MTGTVENYYHKGQPVDYEEKFVLEKFGHKVDVIFKVVEIKIITPEELSNETIKILNNRKNLT